MTDSGIKARSLKHVYFLNKFNISPLARASLRRVRSIYEQALSSLTAIETAGPEMKQHIPGTSGDMMRRPQSIRTLVAVAVLFSLCTGLAVTTNRVTASETLLSAETLKVSPDLRQLIQSGNGNKTVKLIVQSKSSSGLLGGLLQTVGGVLKAVLSTLNISIVEGTANAANVIAADPNVAYVSMDAPVRSSGHVTTTTGVQQVRVQKNSETLDGSGVTIAILDSGIDSRHKSFSTLGKIKFNKDFTGENRTDDPWGHGTHVAAIAAGDGAPTGGAYEGVAPAANLVNLRVLNSDGVGTISGVLSALDWVMSNKSAYNIRVVKIGRAHV